MDALYLGESPELQQVYEVEVPEPEGALVVGHLGVEPLPELFQVGPELVHGRREGAVGLAQEVVGAQVDGDAIKKYRP